MCHVSLKELDEDEPASTTHGVDADSLSGR